ncbi:AI-2E family transporter [Kibdelosporangium persicum]
MPRQRADEPVAHAERIAAEISGPDRPLGEPGQPVNRRSPFFVGLTAALGVSLAVGAAYLIVTAADTIVLVCLAFFIAVGLDPIVRGLGRWMARPAAVTAVVVAIAGLLSGFAVAVAGMLTEHGGTLMQQVSDFRAQLTDPATFLGRLDQRLHLTAYVDRLLDGAGTTMVDAVTGLAIVSVLTVYFLADFPRLRRVLIRLAPASRRPRAVLIGDEIFAKVGAYLLGNVLLSLVAAVATFIWAVSLGIPYPLLLATVVAVLDLIPIAGALLAGVIVALMALTVSLPVCLATVGFLVAYQLIEDYLLLPKIIGRAVRTPAVVTLVAVLLGAVLLGVIGALVAVPIAAAILLMLTEIWLPYQDQR